jgi:hypothetical protein
MMGILALRWMILLGIAVFLAREGWITWNTLHSISEDLSGDGHQAESSHVARGRWRRRFQLLSAFIMITAVPIQTIFIWTSARYFTLRESLDHYGWSYGMGLEGSLVTLFSFGLSLGLLYLVWGKLKLEQSITRSLLFIGLVITAVVVITLCALLLLSGVGNMWVVLFLS